MFGSLLFHPQTAAALWRAWSRAASQPARRGFGLDRVVVDGVGRSLIWRERPLSPFVTLSSVQRADLAPERTVLVVPPLSGGFAFLLRDVVEFLAEDCRVLVLEWLNARFAPVSAGRFDFDDQIQAIHDALRISGAGAHLVALCQSVPAAFCAACALAEDAPQLAPCSVSLIAGPIDPLAAPSAISAQIRDRTLEDYRGKLLPRPVPGGERLVYPAESQMALLFMTLAAQTPSQDEFSRLILDSAEAPPDGPSFLETVTSFMDLPAEFFLDSLSRIYLHPRGPAAGLCWRGRTLDPRALDAVSILVVEGGRDRVAAPGQTRAALTLTPGDGRALRRAHLEPEAGHFGVFHGPLWRDSVAPRLREAIRAAEAPRRPAAADPRRPFAP